MELLLIIQLYFFISTEINFKNLAQPVWNSSQELTSLLLHNESYDFSVSFTLVNDINTFCHHNKLQKFHR